MLPAVVGTAIIIFIILLATTDLFSPLAQYLHDYTIIPIGAAACVITAIAIMFVVFKLLVKLGKSLLVDEDEP